MPASRRDPLCFLCRCLQPSLGRHRQVHLGRSCLTPFPSLWFRRALPSSTHPTCHACLWLRRAAADLAATEPEVRQILLAQKAAWNWAEFQARYNFSGWDETTNICAWTGVRCSYNTTDEEGNDVLSTDPLDGFSV